MKFLIRWSNPADWYLDTLRRRWYQKIVDVPDGSQTVRFHMCQCPCGDRHAVGIVSPNGEVLYCADSLELLKEKEQ